MSKVLIISDSHFLRKNELIQFISQFQDIDRIIHCGDIYMTFMSSDFPNMHICRGNNDFADIPKINHFIIDNVKFTITHGHLNNYAYNPLNLKNLLENYPSDVICFGHTHVPYYHADDDVIIINPGSLALSRTFPKINTYVIFDTQTKKASFYDAKTHDVIEI